MLFFFYKDIYENRKYEQNKFVGTTGAIDDHVVKRIGSSGEIQRDVKKKENFEILEKKYTRVYGESDSG